MKRLIMMSLIATCCLTTVLAQKTVISQKDQKEEPFNVVEIRDCHSRRFVAPIDYQSARSPVAKTLQRNRWRQRF